ncbi:hypothetical protein WAF17_15375 [Bernardetia sp. ABR2-2B]|uniref:hypothetical protein n=1 Tax=Bernardetia sp. ABR2-2B TaxID=3127472 RepID=UPI0030CD0999
MNLEVFLKKYAANIIGFSMAVCNLIWLSFNVWVIKTSFFPQGHFYCFRPPLWTTFLESAIALLGMYIAFLIFNRKVSYLKWSLIDIVIMIITFAITLYVT